MVSSGYNSLLSKCFPKKYRSSKTSYLAEENREALAFDALAKGEIYLLEGRLEAIRYFDEATKILPNNPEIWHRQGLSFFEYGIQKGKEKILLLASRSCKEAVRLKETFYEAYISWAKVLLELGYLTEETQYFYQAKEKIQKALEFSKEMEIESLIELHADLGRVWTEIAAHSGEAFDLRLAIQSFRTALSFSVRPTADFWHDFGKAYLHMGLLINSNEHYLQAIRHFEKATLIDESHVNGFLSRARAYSQLYINTMDEAYFHKASDSFSKAIRLDSYDEELWLEWSSLLCESGRQNRDPKKLRLSIEKIIRANSLCPDHAEIKAQWVEALSLLGEITARHDLLVEAEKKIEKASEIYPDEPAIWYAYGVSMASFGNYFDDPYYFDEAIEKIQKGLSLDKRDAELWHLLGYSHYRLGVMLDDVDLFGLSTKFYKKANGLKPSCPALIFDYARAQLHRGELIESADLVMASINLFEEGIKLQKNSLIYHPKNLFNYAIALYLYGELTEEEPFIYRAVEVFWQVLLIDPDYPGIHFRLALAFANLADFTCDNALYEKAFTYFALAEKQSPEDQNLFLEWGLALINFSHHAFDESVITPYYQEAKEKLHTAGLLGNQHAYYHLACLHSLIRNPEKALELLEIARKMEALPEREELLYDEWLEPLKGYDAFSEFLSRLDTKQKIVDDTSQSN